MRRLTKVFAMPYFCLNRKDYRMQRCILHLGIARLRGAIIRQPFHLAHTTNNQSYSFPDPKQCGAEGSRKPNHPPDPCAVPNAKRGLCAPLPVWFCKAGSDQR